MKRFIIFTGGKIYSSFSLKFNQDDIFICADSGLYHSYMFKIKPDVVIGDFDSFVNDNCIIKDYPECKVIKYSPEKDDTDTMLCVKYAIEHGADNIIICGGLSGRLDHTIANIQTLRYCAERNIYAIIDDGYNNAVVQGQGESEYPYQDNSYFSIFALTDNVKIENLSGVKYPLENYTLTSGFPLGVSNEIISEKAYLKISEGYALVIYSKK